MTTYEYKLVSSSEENPSNSTSDLKVTWTNNWQEACDFFSFDHIRNMSLPYEKYWYIQAISEDGLVKTIESYQDIEEHSETLMAERNIATDEGMAKQIIDFHGKFEDMSEESRDEIINPKHYEVVPPEAYTKHPDGLEYMDIMQYLLAHHSGVQAHLLGQIFKYAIRLGQKDAKLQDAKKIQWYANYLVDVIEEEK